MSDGKKTYEFTEAGFFDGAHRAVGERIRLHPRQAQYDLHRLRDVVAVEAPPEVPATRRGSRRRS